MSDQLWDAVAANNLGVLATLKRDGRPQLSEVNYCAEPGLLRISTRTDLAKARNIRRDPRVSLSVSNPRGGGYAVVEGTAELSAPSQDPHDATVEELVDVYRKVGGKEHPDWDDYRRAMVADGRVVLRIRVDRLYGWIMG